MKGPRIDIFQKVTGESIYRLTLLKGTAIIDSRLC